MRHVLVLVTLLALAGCAAKTAEDPGQTLDNFVRVSPKGYPGAWAEVNLRMMEGGKVSWRFNASGPLAWDVHTHNGQQVETLDEGNADVGSGEFQAPRAGYYSLYFQNNDAKSRVDLTYHVQGDFEVDPPRAG